MARGSALTKKLDLSDELAEFMGKSTASRAEVMKALWKHIKKEDLQVPSNKRNIDPDDVLEPILGSRTITMFQIAGKLNKHFV